MRLLEFFMKTYPEGTTYLESYSVDASGHFNKVTEVNKFLNSDSYKYFIFSKDLLKQIKL